MYWQLFESYNLMSDLLLRIETHLRLAEAQGNNRIVFKLLYEAAQEIQFLGAQVRRLEGTTTLPGVIRRDAMM
jgi:hypothetical protein